MAGYDGMQARLAAPFCAPTELHPTDQEVRWTKNERAGSGWRASCLCQAFAALRSVRHDPGEKCRLPASVLLCTPLYDSLVSTGILRSAP